MENKEEKGHIHPLTAVIRESVFALNELGFLVADGPEVEDDFHNFNALNIPEHHPSRDMQDTFWLKNPKDLLLRTQTSSVQIRFMEKNKPPFRIISPGKVFRNEATDATHEAQFYQIEGLLVDEKTNMAELKGTLSYVFKKILGKDSEIRFRPSYFPFVEPGVEVDIKWGNKWLEVAGAGMVNQNVFKAVNIDCKKWRGFAFGFGPDRIAMIKHKIPDIRLFYSGDLRLINQFEK